MWSIDWNGDGIIDQIVTGASGTTVDHQFDKGTYTVKVYSTDKDGVMGAASTFGLIVH